MLLRFGPALRADLQEVYGVDLAQIFREKRWVHLLHLIDGLHSNSRYVQAMYEDEAWMEMVTRGQDEPTGRESPPLATWSPEVDMLAKVNDSLAVLTQTLIGVNGGKPKKIKPMPRPLADDQPAEFTEAQQSVLEEFLPGNK